MTEKARTKDELRKAISDVLIPCRNVGFSVPIRPWKVVYLGVLMVIAVGLGHQPSAFAQNKAAQTAAGAIIIQNNQMRQELRETRRELKEIKEGLGIEGVANEEPSSSPTDSEKQVALTQYGVLSVVFALIVYGILFAIASKRFRYAREGNSERAGKLAGLHALGVSTVVFLLYLFVILPALGNEFVEGYGAYSFFGFLFWIVFVSFRTETWGKQLVLRYQAPAK